MTIMSYFGKDCSQKQHLLNWENAQGRKWRMWKKSSVYPLLTVFEMAELARDLVACSSGSIGPRTHGAVSQSAGAVKCRRR